ncbi:MAG: hypothetical protein COB02_13825 [Candidatus Cloacimonadota bacterium]|nr:MAG: hypothetical protein COB02_13825 [Candidatus Cloacimonadota bacterium]
MIFQTSRLCIKKLTIDEFEPFFQLHSDPQVMNPIPAPILNFDASRQELNRILSAYKVKDHRLRVYGVSLLENNKFIGLCAIISTDSHSRSIGYRFLTEYWKRGFGTEVTEGLISYLKQNKKIHKIHAAVAKDNLASKKILKKFMVFTKDELDTESDSYESHFELQIE